MNNKKEKKKSYSRKKNFGITKNPFPFFPFFPFSLFHFIQPTKTTYKEVREEIAPISVGMVPLKKF